MIRALGNESGQEDEIKITQEHACGVQFEQRGHDDTRLSVWCGPSIRCYNRATTDSLTVIFKLNLIVLSLKKKEYATFPNICSIFQ